MPPDLCMCTKTTGRRDDGPFAPSTNLRTVGSGQVDGLKGGQEAAAAELAAWLAPATTAWPATLRWVARPPVEFSGAWRCGSSVCHAGRPTWLRLGLGSGLGSALGSGLGLALGSGLALALGSGLADLDPIQYARDGEAIAAVTDGPRLTARVELRECLHVRYGAAALPVCGPVCGHVIWVRCHARSA